MDSARKLLVRQRAANCCEYCQLPQAAAPWFIFHVEHILPRQHGGTDDPSNLAFACPRCNAHKGTNLTGIDPTTRKVTLLFHPRRQLWSRHFAWDGFRIVGKTRVGRATVVVLALNHPDHLSTRYELRQSELFPFVES